MDGNDEARQGQMRAILKGRTNAVEMIESDATQERESHETQSPEQPLLSVHGPSFGAQCRKYHGVHDRD